MANRFGEEYETNVEGILGKLKKFSGKTIN